MHEEVKGQMDQIYRFQRHIYDLTRKYFLFGRDRLIRELNAQPGEIICEVGCGTARNLIKMAKHYPEARFYGFDASEEMLVQARKSLARNGMTDTIPIAHGFAQNFDSVQNFNLERPVDRFVFSYALSMIPPWEESLEHALATLPIGGKIHVVDFSDQMKLPAWFRFLLKRWLKFFHVEHKPGIAQWFAKQEQAGTGTLESATFGGRYGELFTLTKV